MMSNNKLIHAVIPNNHIIRNFEKIILMCSYINYRIAGYFQRVFILGYFKEASFFKNKFFVIVKKQHMIAPHIININTC